MKKYVKLKAGLFVEDIENACKEVFIGFPDSMYVFTMRHKDEFLLVVNDSYDDRLCLADLNNLDSWHFPNSVIDWDSQIESEYPPQESISDIPKKWYIECTDDNFELCEEYRNLQHDLNREYRFRIDHVLLSRHRNDESYFYGDSLRDLLEDKKYADFKEITTETLQKIVNNLKGTPIKTSIKPTHNENSIKNSSVQVRKSLGTITTRERDPGTPISGRRNAAAVAIGHLSYEKVNSFE
jgi:hypothetical protein